MSVQCLQCLKKFEWESFVYTDKSGNIFPQLRNRPRSLSARTLDRIRGVRWAEDTDRAELLARGIELQCPDGDWVPADLPDNRTVVIGLIGPPGSSKSHYLATAIGQMLNGGLAGFKIAVHAHGFSEQPFYAKYYNPVWREKKTLPKTLPADLRDANPPIALELREGVGGRKWNVVFFDAAGEDVVGAAAQAKHALYLAHASAMIFLVEPSSLPGFADLDDTGGTYPTAGAAGIINSTAKTLRTVRHFPEEHSFREIPTAVVVAKSDLLDGVAGLPPELRNDPDGQQAYLGPGDLRAIRQRSDSIVHFLERQRAHNLFLTVHQAFPNYTFHLASATGHAAKDNRFAEIAPRRCLDPVVSVLAGLDVLSAEARSV